MKTDSFENFGRYKDLVNEKLNEFILTFQNEPKRTKKLLHYQSVINISKEIIRFNNSEANNLKDSMLEYLDIAKNIDFSIDENTPTDIYDKRRKSLDLYQKHISPVGSYLVHESGFGPDASLKAYLIIGILLDLVIYYFISKSIVPLATILVVVTGVMARNKKEKTEKFFLLLNKKLHTTMCKNNCYF